MPRSAATEITSRLVEVPIAVPMPPRVVASPMGIRIFEEGMRVRSETVIMMGRSMITMGVLLRKPLTTAQTARVTTMASLGREPQARPTMTATGCSAPVFSSPLPRIIRQAMVTRASWPNPLKKSVARTRTPSWV